MQSKAKAKAMMSLKPICAVCNVFYRPHRNGTYFTECMENGQRGWVPYKVWCGDMWKCPSCGSKIIVGVGKLPLCEHYQEGFEKLRERTEADKINIVSLK